MPRSGRASTSGSRGNAGDPDGRLEMSPSLASAPALIVADEVALGVAIAGGAVLLVLALGWWSSHRELTGRSRDPARHLLEQVTHDALAVLVG